MVTIEQARKKRPLSKWYETTTPHFLIEQVGGIWVLWLASRTGERVDGFKRKRDALAVAKAMAPYKGAMAALIEMGNGVDPARQALVIEVNDAYLAATRGMER